MKGPFATREQAQAEADKVNSGKALPSEEADVTPEKARAILRDGTVHGKPLTEKQRGMFGAIAGQGKKAAPGSPEWEEEEAAEPEHQEKMSHRKMCKAASGFFKELSQIEALEDSHRQRIGEVRKQLEDIGTPKEDGAADGEEEEPQPGDLGEKGINRIKAFYDQQERQLEELAELTKALNGTAAGKA